MSKALLNRICLFLACAGIFVAGFLSLAYALNVSIPCGGSTGCDTVAAHPTSRFMGVPVAYFGLMAYLALAGIAILRLLRPNAAWLSTLGFALTMAGTLLSFVLVFISLFVIHATCKWCMASAIIMILSLVFNSALAASNKPDIAPNGMDWGFSGAFLVIAFGMLGLRYGELSQEKHQDIPTPLYAKERKIEDFVPPEAPFLGDKDAPVVVVEFGDLLCPHCRNSYFVMKDMVKEKKGKLKFVFRHFSLIGTPGHEWSAYAALVSEYAAEKGKFWQYLDLVFQMDKEKASENSFLGLAAQLQLDAADVYARTHEKDDPTFLRFYRDREVADKLGILTTPSFLIALKGETPELEGLNTYKVALEDEKYQKAMR